ncbi:MAG: hypothetical protein K9K80_02510 [Spirochaetia bacterium]|nr:hypothetical protein [Spirochaetia bacterium]
MRATIRQATKETIDIGYDAEVRLFDPWVMGYIAADAYTISDNTLVGVYTSNDNTDSEEEFDITIDFSYSGGVLTAVVVTDGALGNKTLNLVPAE